MSTKPVLLINGNPVGDIGGEGGSGGHTIIDSSGTSLAQESGLQFVDAFLTDDSVNGRTIVENIKEVSPADYASTTDEGIIVTDDGDDALIGPVSDDYVEVEADGDKTLSTLLNELFALTDFSKISEHSYILSGANNKNLYYIAQYNSTNQTATFVWDTIYSSTKFIQQTYNLSSNSSAEQIFGTDYSSVSGAKLSSGTKLTLYYGNKTAVVDLQTTANRCLLNSGQTVESALTPLLGSLVGGSLNDLKETFIGFGYNVTGAPDGNYGFLFCIKSIVDGSVAVNQNWCKNDSTTWHTRIFRNGSWGNWS